MRRTRALAFVLAVVASGCGRAQWPSPSPVDRAVYQQEHEAWLGEERAYLSEILPVSGIWPLDDGETSFGADPGLPISLPAAHLPRLAGTFRRAGDTVTVSPVADFVLRLENGTRVAGETQVESVLAGPLRLEVTDAGDDRRWVIAIDTTHAAISAPPELPSYPLDEQWRLLARFDRFDSPKRMRVPDVRGGFMEFTAVGQLVFRLNGDEFSLTAVGQEGDPRFAVWFKDRTNGVTTYRGYRVIRPQVVEDGKWTVLDFNFTYNPPCAYSHFTTCPLPPPENRLPVSIEAGLKQLPSVQGY